MSSEGVRAAAAAWMRVNQAVYDEERKKIVEKFKDGSKPWFHLDAPLTMSRQEYKDFISRELEGIKVSWAFIEGLGLFVGRDRSALIDGAREYLATTFPGARENPPGVFVINARRPYRRPIRSSGIFTGRPARISCTRVISKCSAQTRTRMARTPSSRPRKCQTPVALARRASTDKHYLS